MSAAKQSPVLIGIDIGTSSVKAVLSSVEDGVLDSFSASHGMARPKPGYAEQAPADWMKAVHGALEQFARHSAAGSVVAIGVTSQVNTHVFCDETLKPLRQAITWQDTRAADDGAALDGRLAMDVKIAALGAPIPIDASHALSRMAWMRKTLPDLWAKTQHVFSPKDYVIAELTGSVMADPLASVGLVGTHLTYADAVLDLLPRSHDVLPPLADPLSIAGDMRDGLPFAGVPVAVGTMDAWASMFGLGVAHEGEAMYLSGTSEVLGLISEDSSGTPGIIVFPPWRGITLHAAPTQSGGASLAWLGRLLGLDVAELSGLAAQAVIAPNSPLFLPHLEGERAPLWDPHSRGGFAGLSSATGPEELAAAVMEGVAFSARLAVEAMATSGDQPITALRHGGGGAVSDIWCQIRANALGRTLHRVNVPETGASGALVMAGVAAGVMDDLAASTEALVKIDRVFEPEPPVSDITMERFEQFKALYENLSPIARTLNGASNS
ncbi:MAG: FGGY family carbohydrate kinase [Pseudomonadota bacterium]